MTKVNAPLYLLTAIAICQWLVLQLPNIHPEYDPTTFLYGNLQIISILALWKFINKYINLG